MSSVRNLSVYGSTASTGNQEEADDPPSKTRDTHKMTWVERGIRAFIRRRKNYCPEIEGLDTSGSA